MKYQIILGKSLAVVPVSSLSKPVRERFASTHPWAKFCIISDSRVIYGLADTSDSANDALKKLTEVQGCTAHGIENLPDPTKLWQPTAKR